MATPVINFTQQTLHQLANPGSRWIYFADEQTPGLRLGVGPNGHKTFYLYRRICGRPERVKIGPFPDLSVAYARTQAWALKAAIGGGANPGEARRALRAAPTLEELFNEYIEKHAKAKGRKSWPEMQAQFRRYLSTLGKRSVAVIKRSDVERLVTALAASSGKTTANRVIELVRATYNWANRKGIIKAENPAIGVDRYSLRPRDRFLHPSEMPTFLEAIEKEDPTNRDFFTLLLLTGVRKGNLMGSRWADINLADGIWRINADQSKNGRPQYVRLAPAAVEILERRKCATGNTGYVFPAESETGHITSPKKAWSRIINRSGLKDLRPHDLRRTNASWQLAAGATLQEVGKSLNHRDIKSTLVYAHLDLSAINRNVDQAVQMMLRSQQDEEEAIRPINEVR